MIRIGKEGWEGRKDDIQCQPRVLKLVKKKEKEEKKNKGSTHNKAKTFTFELQSALV